MIPMLSNRQGFTQSLGGVENTSVQSVYVKPAVEETRKEGNSSWYYPFGDPWGWQVYPWNWGKEGEADKEAPTPDGAPPGAQGSIPENPVSNVFVLAAIAGIAWFLLYGRS